MLLLETPRLRLLPLSYAQLQQYVQPGFVLETTLNLTHHPRLVSDALAEAFKESIFPAVSAATNELPFVTLWTIILKATNTMVGDLCFKGPVNSDGEVEIGYGTYPDFCGNGYMTEAVSALCTWAFEQTGVLAVIAETSNDNTASHKILSKNNFTITKEVDKMLWWRLKKTT